MIEADVQRGCGSPLKTQKGDTRVEPSLFGVIFFKIHHALAISRLLKLRRNDLGRPCHQILFISDFQLLVRVL